MKAKLVFQIVRLTRLVDVTQARLSHDQSFDEELINTLLKFAIGLTHALQRINKTFKTSLMGAIIIQVFRRVLCSVLLELFVLFIDGVISQVHEEVANVILARLDVRFCGQSDQTIFK